MNNKLSQRFPLWSSATPKWIAGLALAVIILWYGVAPAAQPTKVDRVGVIHMGGVLGTVADGLRAGLKELGLDRL